VHGAVVPTAPRGGVLRQAGFRLLWLANGAGDVAQQVSALALSVTAVLVLDATPIQVGLLTALGFGANLVLAIPAGVWVDRWQKKRVLVGADLLRAAAVATVPVAHVFGVLTLAQLMVVAAATSVAAVLFDTAHTSVLPVLVSREHVAEANARLQTTDNVVGVVGPGLAGQALRLTSGPALYLVTAVMQLTAALLVSRLQVHEPALTHEDREPFWPALRTGLRYVLGHPVLRSFTLVNAAINLGAGMFMAVLPVFLLRDLAVPPSTLGLLYSAGSIGGVLGSLVALRLGRRVGEIRTKVLTTCALPAAFAAAPLSTLLPGGPVPVLAAGEFGFGLLIVIGAVSTAGVRARTTPARLMGRVASAGRFVTQGAVPVGALLAGASSTVLGNVGGLWTAAGLAGVGGLLALCSPLRTMRGLPAHLEAAGMLTPRPPPR